MLLSIPICIGAQFVFHMQKIFERLLTMRMHFTAWKLYCVKFDAAICIRKQSVTNVNPFDNKCLQFPYCSTIIIKFCCKQKNSVIINIEVLILIFGKLEWYVCIFHTYFLRFVCFTVIYRSRPWYGCSESHTKSSVILRNKPSTLTAVISHSITKSRWEVFILLQNQYGRTPDQCGCAFVIVVVSVFLNVWSATAKCGVSSMCQSNIGWQWPLAVDAFSD